MLQCNSYEVIDLGVMVPTDTILQRAQEEQVDIVGLSGLITPSLDEMVHLAKEMQRLKLKIPIMIGGATTSLVHTAVKIDPEYSGPAVYVPDASRAVGVASNLLSSKQRNTFIGELKQSYANARQKRSEQQQARNLPTLTEVRANPTKINWDNYQPPTPAKPGIHFLDEIALEGLAPLIDWTPFFRTWELKGHFPKILDDAEKGDEARKLYGDAKQMLQQIIEQKWLTARAVIGLFPANSCGDDITLFQDETRNQALAHFRFLRKQSRQGGGRNNSSLADFVAPKSSGLKDYLGAFACTAGLGVDEKVAEFEAAHDDYRAILLKSLADRLAEALAEWLHQQVRKGYWGYAAEESLDNDALIREEYQGIRPAIGYPTSPDHSEKETLWRVLNAEKTTGIWLTESMAMAPAASVSGLYFSHPDATYFAVGKIGKDQVIDYAERKAITLEVAERWLAPNLAYK